jgi:hypothetical protein
MGQKPHLLVGTVVGTLAAYVAFFRHYTALADDSGALGRRARGARRLLA